MDVEYSMLDLFDVANPSSIYLLYLSYIVCCFSQVCSNSNNPYSTYVRL